MAQGGGALYSFRCRLVVRCCNQVYLFASLSVTFLLRGCVCLHLSSTHLPPPNRLFFSSHFFQPFCPGTIKLRSDVHSLMLFSGIIWQQGGNNKDLKLLFLIFFKKDERAHNA